ncbi:GPW/gp25 family protein [Desulfurobacterium crinifex]
MGGRLFGIEFSSLTEDINQQIEMVLLTRKGEKTLDPEYGCGIWDYLDEGITTVPVLVGSIYKDVSRNVPAISITTVKVTEINEDGSSINVRLGYTIKSSGERGFYEGRIDRPSRNLE